MRIEINYQAEILETAICEAIVTTSGTECPLARSSISSHQVDLFATLAIVPGKMNTYPRDEPPNWINRRKPDHVIMAVFKAVYRVRPED